MSLWLILAAMTALALGLALVPLLRRAGATASRREANINVYRAQLEELRAERERGLLGEKEAQAAELEIKRRMLAAAADDAPRPAISANTTRIATGVSILIAVPALSAAIYWQLGNPDLPSRPFAERADDSRQLAGQQTPGSMQGRSVPPVATMIERLEERLEANPDDLEGWFRLGRAFQLTDQPGRAVQAYERAVALDDGIPELHAALAESAITAADGIVTAKAQAALQRALELDPANPRARFYRGLALVQRGERERALGMWTDLVRDTPADAPWLPVLRQRVTALAEDLGRDPDAVVPAPAPAAVASRGGDGLPDDPAGLRAEAESLAASLDRNPKDWQGWIRLARARAALGRKDAAAAALADGAKAYENAPFVRRQFAAAAAELGIDAPATSDGPRGPSPGQMEAAAEMSPEQREDMIRGMVEGLAARLEDEPDDVAGWRMLARSYSVLGEEEKAAKAAKEVARLLPEDPAAQIGYAQALLALEADDARLSSEVVEQWRRVVELDQDNPEALFFLGRAAFERGEFDRAEQYWQRLLARIPEDAPQRDQLESLLEQLRGRS